MRGVDPKWCNHHGCKIIQVEFELRNLKYNAKALQRGFYCSLLSYEGTSLAVRFLYSSMFSGIVSVVFSDVGADIGWQPFSSSCLGFSWETSRSSLEMCAFQSCGSGGEGARPLVSSGRHKDTSSRRSLPSHVSCSGCSCPCSPVVINQQFSSIQRFCSFHCYTRHVETH